MLPIWIFGSGDDEQSTTSGPADGSRVDFPRLVQRPPRPPTFPCGSGSAGVFRIERFGAVRLQSRPSGNAPVNHSKTVSRVDETRSPHVRRHSARNPFVVLYSPNGTRPSSPEGGNSECRVRTDFFLSKRGEPSAVSPYRRRRYFICTLRITRNEGTVILLVYHHYTLRRGQRHRRHRHPQSLCVCSTKTVYIPDWRRPFFDRGVTFVTRFCFEYTDPVSRPSGKQRRPRRAACVVCEYSTFPFD